ncbi:hypothetical protein GCM10027275_29360 [Rhabdobacter roseus]|uniref:Uncharacterized protein n=1 Tax=Rhabdobacter roseus TaxID=1655419 RepID=A0A840TMN7_9BACT|nr:hypothetical protein [Rhabdobacter roseus]MBB5284891.1 hypothetical protein [Rhabdobacter roseus]
MKSGYTIFLALTLLGGLLGCDPTVPAEPSSETRTGVPASMVSVLPLAAGQAEVVVKYQVPLTEPQVVLSVQDSAGRSLPVRAQSAQVVGTFSLSTYQVDGLAAGTRYLFSLQSFYTTQDTVTVERTYRHQPGTAWRRLPHAPLHRGDYTGAPLTDGVPGGNAALLSVMRYIDATTWESAFYDLGQGTWTLRPSPPLSPRQGLVRFRLSAGTYFCGLGYVVNDKIPGKKVYVKDLWTVPSLTATSLSTVFPAYQGTDGDLAYFTLGAYAYFLTQEGPPAVWSLHDTWEQSPRQPFPEPPGRLATFTLGGLGYVLNQVPGQPPHLYAYDPTRDVWTRRADFPGTSRRLGTAFAGGSKGYFGLGIAPSGEGLRDLWAYDPTNNQWYYATDYPGQGQQYLVATTVGTQVLLGWGYETQIVRGTSARRLVGCTDFWEFTP